MQWLIQSNDLPDQHTAKLITAVKNPILFQVVPFSHEVLGLDNAIPGATSMFYCSTQMAEKVSTWDIFRPGVFWNSQWWDPLNWLDKRDDLLNNKIETITAGKLRELWVDKPTFIKSAKEKLLTGMVIEPDKQDHDNWLIEQSTLDAHDIILMSPCTEIGIETECRFFVLEGKIITGSTYRWNGVRFTTRPIDAALRNYANSAVRKWMPSSNIVIDICRLKNGEYKTVEFNSINSSGFYNCDVQAIVNKIEEMYT